MAVARPNEGEDALENIGVGAVKAVAGIRFLPRRIQEVGIDSADGVSVPVIVDEERCSIGDVFLIEEGDDRRPVELSTIWERKRACALRPVDSDDTDEDSSGEPQS